MTSLIQPPGGYPKPPPRPRTLTRQQFAKTKAGRAGKAYAAYVAFLKAHRGQSDPGAYDPTTPGPAPPGVRDALLGEARDYTTALFNPVIAEISRAYEDRGRRGAEAISGYTSSLADALGGLEGKIAGINQRNQSAQVTADNALAQRVQTGGTELADSLAAALAKGNLDPALADAARTRAKGMGSTAAALGHASLSQLLGAGQAEETFAAKQPGIARLQGLQDLRGHEAQISSSLAEALGDVRSRMPGTVQQVLGDLNNRELQKYVARAGFATDQAAIQQRYDEAAYDAQVAAADDQKKAAEKKTSQKRATANARASRQKEAYNKAVELAQGYKKRTRDEVKYGKKTQVANPVPPVEARRQLVEYLQTQLPWLTAVQARKLAERAMSVAGYGKVVAEGYGYPGTGVGGQAGG